MCFGQQSSEAGSERLFRDPRLRPKAMNLVDAAIHIVVGITRRKVGWDVVESTDRNPLLSLAPAVWNAHYLEVGVWLCRHLEFKTDHRFRR